MKQVYSDIILKQTPRLLSLIDRNPYSPTYGCFDRSYWHSQLTDFPSARLQEACLTLALLYKYQYPHNIYYQSPKIKQWAEAAINYWQKIQSTNGSLNEWYPHEHSFVATAFTLYAVTETSLVLNLKSLSLINSIKKSADWLISQTETLVANQQAGAIIALYNVFLLTKQKKYHQAAKTKLAQLIKIQSAEGWFPEYGGADIGYSSVLLDYLAKYYHKSKDKQALTAITKLVDFLQYFVHPNQAAGGNYGSRNTEYLLPDGLAVIAKKNQTAAAISHALTQSLKQYPLNLDDRYLCYNGYVFLQAYRHYSSPKKSSLPVNKSFGQYFKTAGLFIKSTSKYYAIINLKKGGTIKLYSKKNQKLIFQSSGIIGQLSNHRLVSSQWLDHRYQITLAQAKAKASFSITGQLHQVNPFTSSPLSLLLSRLFQLSLGRSQFISLTLKKILRKKLILKSQTVPIQFTRQFNFNQDNLQLTTQLKIQTNLCFQSLSFNHQFSLIYVPSTRYFHPQEMDFKSRQLSQKLITSLNQSRQLSLTQTIKL